MWQVRIDTGGTFTDAIGISPEGNLERLKVLSSGRLRLGAKNGQVVLPGDGVLVGAIIRELGSTDPLGRVSEADAREGVLNVETDRRIIELDPGCDAPVLAMHLLTATPLGDPLPPIDLRIATTRATNAILTNTLDRVLLITTKGFEDLPVIDNQARDDIFALNPSPPRLLPSAVLGVDARLCARGNELLPIDEEAIAAQAVEIAQDSEIDSIAIVLLHAWANPEHELRLAQACLRHGLNHISLSHSCAPGIGLVARMRTTIANASLATTINSFTQELCIESTGGASLFMNSAGGLRSKNSFAPCESFLSGPAAGVSGAIAAARAMDISRAIAFDMGGTSTDVSRYAERVDLKDETTVGPTTVRVPSIAIETVAAGGGSICTISDGRLQVGPESAGAEPGPACYGDGGPLCITDVNLLLGRIDPCRFGFPLDQNAAQLKLDDLLAGTKRDPDATLRGLLSLANEHMADAIRTISVKQGQDPCSHALVAFGGAGGQHACAIADRLGMNRIIIPANTGLLSAIGLHSAGRNLCEEVTVLQPIKEVDLKSILKRADLAAKEQATHDGINSPEILRRQLRCRLKKQESTLDIEYEMDIKSISNESVSNRFAKAFRDRFGYDMPDQAIELAAVRVFAGVTPTYSLLPNDAPVRREESSIRLNTSSQWRNVPVLDRASIGTEPISGPALILEATATTVLEEGWAVTLDHSGAMDLRRSVPSEINAIKGEASREIVEGRLESIARDMGEALRRTALSVNVRERLDYSCAVMDGDGKLIVNAPHMPVHLGSMGVCVRAVAERLDLADGDTALVNHPAFGGSHLPDLTLITPVFHKGLRVAYVANRAHHAEIGGTRAGSMPPDATTLEEEGVIFEPTLLVQKGEARLAEIEEQLRTSKWPSRLPNENISDLTAQLAANRLGADRVSVLVEAIGYERFVEDLAAMRNRCGESTCMLANRFKDLDWRSSEYLDDGSAIALHVKSDGERFLFDFSGTAPMHSGNLNAPPAVTTAAVLYVLRVLGEQSMPLNEGMLEGVEIVLPSGTMLSPIFLGDPTRDPAVAIGNTETSQRVVDTLLRAFGVAACSQGTMNNTLLGTPTTTYYETVCGGAGATPMRAGRDAVHTHMTNTRITDPEVFEHGMPVRLWTFAIRQGSGGAGTYRGGNGVLRAWEALEPIELCVLGQHRAKGPYGMQGGESGEAGIETVYRASGDIERCTGSTATLLEPGDRFELKTPGGGGWGIAAQD